MATGNVCEDPIQGATNILDHVMHQRAREVAVVHSYYKDVRLGKAHAQQHVPQTVADDPSSAHHCHDNRQFQPCVLCGIHGLFREVNVEIVAWIVAIPDSPANPRVVEILVADAQEPRGEEQGIEHQAKRQDKEHHPIPHSSPEGASLREALQQETYVTLLRAERLRPSTARGGSGFAACVRVATVLLFFGPLLHTSALTATEAARADAAAQGLVTLRGRHALHNGPREDH
mmetsp:Transcript_43891/g.122035  ORF Transcript_43891/g.122035 Transcript_43891/m.122035 type:complete len:231 (-) Transcript_43891:207-899(-)